ncbi:MAG: hypothetical protein ACTILD_07185 [Pseudoalteromonas sp.]
MNTNKLYLLTARTATCLFAGTVTFLSEPVHASVYKCEKEGVVEFSQFPCGKDAELITIKEQNPSVPGNIITHSQNNQTQNGSVDRYIRIKKINAKIQEHENKVDTYTEQMNHEIATLKNQSDAQLNNLTGAKKETAIANQMASVAERYNSLIDREQRDVDRLTKEKQRLEMNTQSVPLSPKNQQSQEIDSFIRTQQITREIQQHQSKIDTYQAQMSREIESLEQQANESPSNLVDATFDNSLSRKMSAVTAKFNTLIDVEQRQIDRLQNEQSSIK